MANEIKITEEQLKKMLARYDKLCEAEERSISKGRTVSAKRYADMTEGMEIVFNIIGIDWANLYTN